MYFAMFAMYSYIMILKHRLQSNETTTTKKLVREEFAMS